mgnify:CR=1 FL=1
MQKRKIEVSRERGKKTRVSSTKKGAIGEETKRREKPVKVEMTAGKGGKRRRKKDKT